MLCAISFNVQLGGLILDEYGVSAPESHLSNPNRLFLSNAYPYNDSEIEYRVEKAVFVFLIIARTTVDVAASEDSSHPPEHERYPKTSCPF